MPINPIEFENTFFTQIKTISVNSVRQQKLEEKQQTKAMFK